MPLGPRLGLRGQTAGGGGGRVRRGWAGTGEATWAGCACSSPHVAQLRRRPSAPRCGLKEPVLTHASKRELAGKVLPQDDKALPCFPEQILVSDPQAWLLSQDLPGAASQARVPGLWPHPAVPFHALPSSLGVLTPHAGFAGDIHQV